MKFSLIVFVSLFFPCSLLSQQSKIYAGTDFDIHLDSSASNLVVFTKTKGAEGRVLDTVFMRFSNDGKITQTSCNDSIVALVYKNNTGYAWHVFQLITDTEQIKTYLQYRRQFDSLQVNRSPYVIRASGNEAQFYKNLISRNWKAINSEFLGSENDSHYVIAAFSKDQSTTRQSIAAVKLLSPFTLLIRRKKSATDGDVLIERLYDVSPLQYGSRLIRESKAE